MGWQGEECWLQPYKGSSVTMPGSAGMVPVFTAGHVVFRSTSNNPLSPGGSTIGDNGDRPIDDSNGLDTSTEDTSTGTKPENIMTGSVGLAVGEQAPDVTATLVRPTGATEPVSLAELVGERPVLLSFYPLDFSPDCIREWCAFRDFEWFASGDHLQVVGASRSSPRIHQEFISRLDLGFPLFADTDLALAEAFGVRYRALGISARARRSCFLLDEDREIRYRWVGEHWLDPTRDVPSMTELASAIRGELDVAEADRFGMA